MEKEIEALKRYFSDKPDVVFAFLFGSRAKKTAGKISDWYYKIFQRSASISQRE